MRILTYISLILFCFASTSCEKEFLIEYIEAERYVVVNSTFSPNKEFEVNLSYSQNVLDLDNSNYWIENAEIRVLRGDGVYLFTPEYESDGNYKTSIFPIANQEYRIEVKVEGYPLITASSRIPTQAIIENVTSSLVEDGDAETVQVDFEIKDSEDTDNYYIWEILQDDPFDGNSSPNGTDIITNVLQTLSPIESVQDNGKWSKLFIQEMDLSTGLSFIFDQAAQNSDPENPDQPTLSLEAYLKVISASSDYYKNLLSLEQLRRTKENDSSVILSTEYHSNINGGFGIFAGYNEQIIQL